MAGFSPSTYGALVGLIRDTLAGAGALVGPPGSPGREIELQATTTHIQWRYVGYSWNDLIALSALEGPTGGTGAAGGTGPKGDDGETPEFRMSGTMLQMKYPSELSWANLYDFPSGAMVDPLDLISADAGNLLTIGSDGKLYVGTEVTPGTFTIVSFTNSEAINEKGTEITAVSFSWSFLNGTPTTQIILPDVGLVNPVSRSTLWTGLHLTDTTTYTLSATDGITPRTATTTVNFYLPIWWGTVPSALPTEADIKAMTKRVAAPGNFMVTLIIADEHSCFAVPMATQLTDIKEKLFNLSMYSTYDVIDNFPITLADGSTELYQILVKKVPEATSGLSFSLDLIF